MLHPVIDGQKVYWAFDEAAIQTSSTSGHTHLYTQTKEMRVLHYQEEQTEIMLEIIRFELHFMKETTDATDQEGTLQEAT